MASPTLKQLQDYIKAKDYQPHLKERYLMKLVEEVGELSHAMLRELRPKSMGDIKGTIDEELWDVMYYVMAFANCYDIDLEEVMALKEKLNREKYGYVRDLGSFMGR